MQATSARVSSEVHVINYVCTRTQTHNRSYTHTLAHRLLLVKPQALLDKERVVVDLPFHEKQLSAVRALQVGTLHTHARARTPTHTPTLEHTHTDHAHTNTSISLLFEHSKCVLIYELSIDPR